MSRRPKTAKINLGRNRHIKFQSAPYKTSHSEHLITVVVIHACSGPLRATAGPGKTLSRGHIPHSVCLEIDGIEVEGEETSGELSSHHPTKRSAERRNLVKMVTLLNRTWILCIF